jgi:3-(3-hydroxy-phenyl)propionate hydroxylase
VLPECPVGNGHVTDLLGRGFTALYFGEQRDAPELPCAVRALPRAADRSGRLYPMYDAGEGTLYLVRPDGHVLARWRDARNADVDAALRHALHASPSP